MIAMQAYVETPFLDLTHDLHNVVQIFMINLSTASFDFQSVELTVISNLLTVQRVRWLPR